MLFQTLDKALYRTDGWVKDDIMRSPVSGPHTGREVTIVGGTVVKSGPTKGHWEYKIRDFHTGEYLGWVHESQLALPHVAAYATDNMYYCTVCGYGMHVTNVLTACQGPGKTAKEKRFVGIGLVTGKWAPWSAEHIFANRALIAEQIFALAKLGRTTRWQATIMNWRDSVRDAENAAECRWALLQFSVYAVHSA